MNVTTRLHSWASTTMLLPTLQPLYPLQQLSITVKEGSLIRPISFNMSHTLAVSMTSTFLPLLLLSSYFNGYCQLQFYFIDTYCRYFFFVLLSLSHKRVSCSRTIFEFEFSLEIRVSIRRFPEYEKVLTYFTASFVSLYVLYNILYIHHK